MTTFYLLRHGRTVGGPGDARLSEEGVAQAEVVAAKLAERPITRVYSSPLARAHETATIIAAATGAPLEVDERLRERANWGDVPGVSWDEFVADWERSNTERDFVVPGGRSAREAGAAAAGFVREAAARDPDGEVAAVAHGGLIVDLLLAFFSEDELLAQDPAVREMRWCAVSELRYENGRAVLASLTDWAA